METLFVYGTLRTTEGHPMHNFLRGYCDLLGEASMGGIKVQLEGYCGVQPSGDPNERVVGELYRIHSNASDDLFRGLDRYEGCSEECTEPHEFFRHRQEVRLLAASEIYDAWVYLYSSCAGPE
ncbi:gamma-glutamylcyclotransferase family protein [Teredinibacter purpureus]|uniref:gamma-glutamylcyclotransferase family protein n=1 Tax=Teredinibacter purpureus TaxID=2731756 RepID=UPI0005F76BA5|nr:gamma-glutamylcyclotransferase family protein [Teredinibacter purpureus]